MSKCACINCPRIFTFFIGGACDKKRNNIGFLSMIYNELEYPTLTFTYKFTFRIIHVYDCNIKKANKETILEKNIISERSTKSSKALNLRQNKRLMILIWKEKTIESGIRMLSISFQTFGIQTDLRKSSGVFFFCLCSLCHHDCSCMGIKHT